MRAKKRILARNRRSGRLWDVRIAVIDGADVGVSGHKFKEGGERRSNDWQIRNVKENTKTGLLMGIGRFGQRAMK